MTRRRRRYRPSLKAFHAFVARLRRHFPLIHHPTLKRSGDFVGFPNGVLVFALRPDPGGTEAGASGTLYI